MRAELLGLVLFAIPLRAEAEGVVDKILLLNESPTDPWALNGTAPFTGERDLYLWFPVAETDELTFGLESTFELMSVTPGPEWSNVGAVQSPHLLFTGKCHLPTNGPVARVNIRDSGGIGGRICIVESTLDSRCCYGECHEEGEFYKLAAYGYFTDGGDECAINYSAECLALSVEPLSWGRAKALYR